MKKITSRVFELFFFTTLLLLLPKPGHSQILWGMTSGGGTYGTGEIFSIPIGDTVLSSTYSMTGIAGANPHYTKLIMASDGKFYGMTANGGINNDGVIFSYDSATKIYTTLFEFNGQNGANPYGSLLQAANGKLYGMTSNGGLYTYGVIFSYDIKTHIYTLIQSCAGQSNPTGSFIQAVNGKLYATYPLGGVSGYWGSFLLYDTTKTSIGIIDDFKQYNGQYPYGSPLQVTDGNIYGLTEVGGYYSMGAIYMYTPKTVGLDDEHDFTTATGIYPYGSLIQSNALLYGMTEGGGASSGGVIFSFDTATKTYKDIHDFSTASGKNPYGDLVQGNNGKLYGVTEAGGANSDGVIFSFDTALKTYKDIYDFNGTNGKNPYGTLLQLSDYSFYGMASAGGATNSGVIFKADTSGNYTKLLDFNVQSDGSNPHGSLVYATNNLFYGMTNQGGKYGYGVLFSYDPSSTTYTNLIDFNDTNGASPYGSLIQATNGLLYGMTYSGGAYNLGVIFTYNYSTSTYSIIHNFKNDSTGKNPYSTLLQAANGKLYGTTVTGGKKNYGTVFSIDMSGANYTVLHSFIQSSLLDGDYPYGKLTQLSKGGGIVGIASSNGSYGYGMAFMIDTGTHSCYDLYDFSSPTEFSHGAFTQVNDTTLYAMAESNGPLYYDGVIFTINPLKPGTNLTIAYAFNITDGYNPKGDLLMGSDGNLYGMTTQGGEYGYGALFQLTPITNVYTKKLDFTGQNGGTPYGDLVEAPSVPTSVKKITAPGTLYFTVYPNPASDILNVSLSHSLNGTAMFSIVDIAGREIMKQASNINGKLNIQLNIENLPVGMYFVRLSSENGFQEAKFVKN
jgi:uncharacterized repeat protein (TIGR03803 family)